MWLMKLAKMSLPVQSVTLDSIQMFIGQLQLITIILDSGHLEHFLQQGTFYGAVSPREGGEVISEMYEPDTLRWQSVLGRKMKQ